MAVNAVVLTWELAQMDFLTIRDILTIRVAGTGALSLHNRLLEIVIFEPLRARGVQRRLDVRA